MGPRFWLPLFPGLSGNVPGFCAFWYDSGYLLRQLRSLFGNRDRYAQGKLCPDQPVEIPQVQFLDKFDVPVVF